MRLRWLSMILLPLVLASAALAAGTGRYARNAHGEAGRFAAADPSPLKRTQRTNVLPAPPGAYIVLPPGAIPAINNPQFIPVASARVNPTSPMILVTVGGETHVYSMYLLDGHEIVNDLVGGEPIATTW